jgi:hypothetical protein
MDSKQNVEYDNNKHISSADIATLIQNIAKSDNGKLVLRSTY